MMFLKKLFHCCFIVEEEDTFTVSWQNPDVVIMEEEKAFMVSQNKEPAQVQQEMPSQQGEDWEIEVQENPPAGTDQTNLQSFITDEMKEMWRQNDLKAKMLRIGDSLSYLAVGYYHLKNSSDHYFSSHFSSSTFEAQQAAEMSLKALLILECGMNSNSHIFHSHYLSSITGSLMSVLSLEDYQDMEEAAKSMDESQDFSQNLCIGARYPEVSPSGRVKVETLNFIYFDQEKANAIYLRAETLYKKCFAIIEKFIHDHGIHEDLEEAIDYTNEGGIEVFRDNEHLFTLYSSVH